MKRRSVTNLSKAKTKQESMRELKSLLLESSYDEINSDYLWKGAGGSDGSDTKNKSYLRKDTSDLAITSPEDGYANDDITSTVHSKHAMSIVDEGKAGSSDYFDESVVDILDDSFASANMEESTSTPVWKGFLEKKSPSIFKGWQKRFVVIGEGGTMTYRKIEESEEISGEVPLVGTKAAWTQPKKDGDYRTLEIQSMNSKDRVFSFRTKSKMDAIIITTILSETIHTQNMKKVIKLCKDADGEDSDDDDDDDDMDEDAGGYDDDGNGDAAGGGDNDGEEEQVRNSNTKGCAIQFKEIYTTLVDPQDPSRVLTKILDYATPEARSKLVTYVSATSSNTLLHICAKSGNHKCASNILKFMPAEFVDAKDNSQMTAAQVACLNQFNRTALAILNCPHFDPMMKGETGDTYLNFASKCKRSVVRKLIDLGVDVLESNVMGNTPLHEMAGYNNVEGVEELLKANKVIVNIQGSKDGYTALHWAARAGASECVDALLANGADCSMPGHTGNTPLHVCISHYVGKSNYKNQVRRQTDAQCRYSTKTNLPLSLAVFAHRRTRTRKLLITRSSRAVLYLS
jgi:hypothetical protein